MASRRLPISLIVLLMPSIRELTVPVSEIRPVVAVLKRVPTSATSVATLEKSLVMAADNLLESSFRVPSN